MKFITRWSMALFVLMFAVSSVFPQRGRGFNQSEITRLYNPGTEATVTGKMIAVLVADSGYGRFPAALVDLATEDKVIKLYVAPQWYLSRENITLQKDAELTVTGSQVTHNNQPLLIVRTMNYQGAEIVIRDACGFPVWAGKRMGPGAGRWPGRGMGRQTQP
ncbi:hypothetical protein JXO59_12660 [candidate division KSB1 bacterium]|nr:hypothetical protein [candidate division KSB1 bacterium]